MDRRGRAAAAKRAEVDTRSPFRSVKEAVALFGEKVLANELYPHRLREKNGEKWEEPSKIVTLQSELKETQHSLEKATEESIRMRSCLSSIKEELEQTKHELKLLKQHPLSHHHHQVDPENQTEDTMITTKFEVFHQRNNDDNNNNDMANGKGFENKDMNRSDMRNVKFTNPQNSGGASMVVERLLERHPSMRITKKKNKKSLIPLVGGLFSKKKPSNEVA